MNISIRRLILRGDALFLGIAATGALFTADLPGAFSGGGPMGGVLAPNPALAIGMVEAHGLAIILAVLLWRATSLRSWHFTGAAIHALLGVCNLVFWNLFVMTQSLTLGYVTTGLHIIFFLLQLSAAMKAPRSEVR